MPLAMLHLPALETMLPFNLVKYDQTGPAKPLSLVLALSLLRYRRLSYFEGVEAFVLDNHVKILPF
jgi:hypothetical protein